jgi:aryl-alcohol dehydrogenase-like predicted oxidoreductase
VIVGNKVGAERGPDRSWIVDGRPETVRRQVHEALTDLGTEASELTYLRLVGDTPARTGTSRWRSRSAHSSSCASRGWSAASACPAPPRRCWRAPGA